MLNNLICAGGVNNSTGAVQASSDGAIPISALHFSPCKLREVSSFIKEHHYSHTHPAGIDLAFSCTANNELVGACAFGYMAGRANTACLITGITDQHKFRELMRLVLLDKVCRNSESRFISWTLRWLKKNTDLLALVSFADTAQGHLGRIYQATNWLYTGESSAHHKRYELDGKPIHERMLYDLYGKFSWRELVTRLDGRLIALPQVIKHRYVYPLKPGLKFKWESLPYPKKKQN